MIHESNCMTLPRIFSKIRIHPYSFGVMLCNILVIVILGISKVCFGIPNRLLIVGFVICLFCSTIYLLFSMGYQKSTRRQTAELFIFASVVISLFLTGLYHYDRAGWNWYMITGYNSTPQESLFALASLTREDFLRRYSYFTSDSLDPNRLVLPKGEYDIDRTVVIPVGLSLVIEPGAVLRFAVGRSLISYGPITARGRQDEMIVFTAQKDWLKWGVVGIVRAEKSIFEYALFEHGRQARVNDVDFFGCLSAIESELEINRCQFRHLYGRDGVYIGKGKVDARYNMFCNLFKDGMDLDGSKGVIAQNYFVNCGDEGIDLSENYEVQVVANVIYDRRGGRIDADHKLEEIKSQNVLGLYQKDSCSGNPVLKELNRNDAL